jgi:hypothetical protein
LFNINFLSKISFKANWFIEQFFPNYLSYDFIKTFTDRITMGNEMEQKRKYDHTQDDTCRIEQTKEKYRRKKQQSENIEGISDNVIRYFHLDVQQQEIEPGMHTYYR